MATAAVIVTGVPVAPEAPTVPPRRSIVDLYNTGGPQWDLYVQALGAMQAANVNDPESYFQLSAIHGAPYFEYDNTGGKNTDGWPGYCPHGELIFLSWHRAYLALFEQVLVKHAKDIAMTYPEQHRPRYIEAADTLRLPFWDWAMDEAVPNSTVPETLNIKVTENGKLIERNVENPLHTFKFPKAVTDGLFGDFDPELRSQIYRCNQANHSYPDSANKEIRRGGYKARVYDTFTRSLNFSQFSAMGNRGESLESIHGGIHWAAACQGQFVSIPLTGFDPLFMLHHTNVDRLWAYWQALHPDEELFSGEYEGLGRWATPVNTIITTSSPLEPFRRSEIEFHTSDTVRSIHDLGYSYIGFEVRNKIAEDERAEVARRINELEPKFVSALSGRETNGEPDGPRPILTRYFAHLSVEVSEFERPCSIELNMNGTYVGSLVLLSMPEHGVVYGEIPLDSIYSILQGKSNGAAVDTLESFLEIDIIKDDGSTVCLAEVPSLGIQMEAVRVEMPRSKTELPEYSGSQLFEIRLKSRS